MADRRVDEYARLIVDRCLGVERGWQVLVRTTPLARPLHEAVVRLIARRGAYALTRLSFSLPFDFAWLSAAPLDVIGALPEIERHQAESIDALLTIWAPENTRDGSDLEPERRAAYRRATAPLQERVMSLDVRWAIVEYATHALAQEAGIALREFEEVLYSACLIDWDEQERRLRRIAARFDATNEVRIVGDGTDLRLSVAGRDGVVSAGYRNMPDGEVFYAPVEDSAEGVVTFSEFVAAYPGGTAEGVRLCFEGGRVVEASARSGEEFLLQTLDTDAGARRLGEFGIGANPAITRYMRNVGFDEKIDGTIHLALGASYAYAGGTNESAVHWDLVKDLRNGGALYCDGELVQESGRWRIA